jgi:glucosamine 6-phosphate synthetase-like amidotransferase/phosphosugar isomerase protein
MIFGTIIISLGLESQIDASLCDFVFRTSVGEKSSAFTISHSCAITVLTLIAIKLGKITDCPINDLPNYARKLLELEPSIQKWAKGIYTHVSTWYITSIMKIDATSRNSIVQYYSGYGLNEPNAYEVALKLKEACYIQAEGFQLEQLIHGTSKMHVISKLNVIC